MALDAEQQKLAEELLFCDKKAPSFAKQLYFGIFDSSSISPYPHPSDNENEITTNFLEQLQTFADQNIDADWIDRNGTIPDNVVAGLSKLGVMGMNVPKEYGGLGMSQNAYCRATELLAQKCNSTALFVNVHQSIGLRSLLLYGTPEQKQRWLGPLARGEKIAAFSLTEPNAGSDANGIETRAVYDPIKNVYRITGNKQWTTNGSLADVITVMAKTEIDTPEGKKDKVTAFLVTPDMPGFSITNPALEKVGMRGTKTANLAFNNVEVPAANILGPIGGGLKVCLTVLDYGRTTFGASCTGIAKLLVKRAIDHARTRHQFGRPLAAFGLVKEKIAMISALSYAMESTTYLTAGLIDAKVEDFMLESAMLKVFASDSLWSIIYDTMQIFGGRSFFTSEPFERIMRDSRLNQIGEGSNEVMRVFIGTVGLRDVGMELKQLKESIWTPWKNINLLKQFGKRRLHCRQVSRMQTHSPELQTESLLLGKAVRRFGIANIRLLAHYKEDIIEHQLELNRLATSAIAIYTTTAVLSRLDAALRNNKDRSKLQQELEVGKLYCRYAMSLLNANLDRLFDPFDHQLESVSDLITLTSFPSFDAGEGQNVGF